VGAQLEGASAVGSNPTARTSFRDQAMQFSWIVIARAELDYSQGITSCEYFQVERNPGFLKPLGITNARAYRPWLISPYIDIWQEIERKINKETAGSARGRSPVLRLRDPGQTLENIYVFTIRFYRPNIFCIEVQMKGDFDLSIDEAFKMRNLDAHASAEVAVDSLIGILKSGLISGYPQSNSFYSKAAVLIPSGVDSDAKCNTWGARAHQGKIGFSPSSPPPSAAFRRCEGGSEERKIE
jgi:hypothetical protein